VSKYLNPQATSAFTKIPLIKKARGQGEVVIENHNITRELLQAFFLALLLYKQEKEAITSYNQLL